MNSNSKAVVLLSGGMDSTTLASIAKAYHKEVHALNVFYGQKHDIELECAKAVAEYLQLDSYNIRNLDGIFSNSSLLKDGPEISDSQEKAQVGSTVVPARNAVLLSVAASFAESIGAQYIYYGAHAEDHGGYPDCRPEFLTAISKALELGTVSQVQIEAPFIKAHKTDIVVVAYNHKAPLHLTHSCYRGTQPACGTCPTCQLRIEAFVKARLIDPIDYAIDIDWSGCAPFPIKENMDEQRTVRHN